MGQQRYHTKNYYKNKNYVHQKSLFPLKYRYLLDDKKNQKYLTNIELKLKKLIGINIADKDIIQI